MRPTELSPRIGAGAAGTTPAAPSRLALLVILCGSFMAVLDFFIVNVALPAMQHELNASAGTLQMVVASYGLATAAGMITGGRLGDMFGRRRLFIIGLALFSLASLACGAAPNGEVLVAARVLQGVAGAVMQPQVLAMIGLAYTGEARAKAFGAYGLSLGLAATLGQLIGGALIELDIAGLGWRSCFLINVPVGVAALLLAPRHVPALRASPPAPGTPGSRLDLAGMVLVALTSTAIVLPLVEGRQQGWPLWSGLCLAAALPLVALLRWQQRGLAARGGAPLLAPELLRQARFKAGLLTALVFYVGNASLYFVLALYLQQGLALAPLASGIVFTALAVGFFITSLGSARLARRFGGPPVTQGALLLAAGHALQWVNVSGAAGVPSLAWTVPILFVQGAALGMVMAPLSSAVLAGLPPQHAGVASGILATVQQAGNALGVALIGLLFYGPLRAGASAHAYAHAFADSLLYLGVSALLVAAFYRRTARLAAS